MNVVNIAPPSVRSALLSPDFVDSIGVGFVLQDARGAIIDCNRAATDLLGLSIDDIMGRTSHDAEWGAVHLDGSAFPGDEHPAMAALRTGHSVRSVIMGVDNPGRARRWILVDAWPIRTSEGVSGVLSSFDDQTVQIVRERLFRALARVNELVISERDEAGLLTEIANVLVTLLGFSRVEFVLHADAPDERVVFAHSTQGMSGEHVISPDDSIDPVRAALREHCVQVVNELPERPTHGTATDLTGEVRYRSLFAAPVALGDGVVVLAIYGARRCEFDETTVEGLTEIVKACEYGVAHVRSMKRLEVAFDSTLAALSGIVERRDPYTAGHQARVGELSELIGRRLGLDESLVGQIRRAGEVHDIGKVAVPAEILTKPRRLTSLEYELMQVHSRVGWEILSKAALPWPIAEVALQHHERLDGSGYPYGLVGDEICLPARIVVVADVLEAMIRDRPYRPGYGLDAAIAEVQSGAGVLYDAEAVAAAVEILAEGFTFGDSARDNQGLPALD